ITTLKVNTGRSVLEIVDELNKNDRQVEYAEPNYMYRALALPDDISFNSLWALNNTGQTGGSADADIDAPEAWNTATGTADIVVAVIDTGIDYTHPDLINNVWVNPGEIAGNGIDDDANGYIDDVYGVNAITHSGNPMDDNGHGTHVSGTIGGEGNNSQGVAGVNWDVSVMGVKFLDASGNGSTVDAIKALEYVLTMKQAGVNIRVTNHSWGGGGPSVALKNAFEAVGNAGILNAAAAGNGNYDNDANPNYPSSYDLDTIISVGATDHNDNRSSFSQWGATSVDLGAPGSNILSTVPGNGYSSYNGTSMATPHVAGAAALLASQFPAMTATGIKARLVSTVDVKSQLHGLWGSNGRLNIANALNCEPGNPVMSATLGSGFAVNQHEDTPVYASLYDCDPVAGATVIASFNNGDAQISLLDDGIAPDRVVGDGVYSGTWTASGIGATTVVFTSDNPDLSTSVSGEVVERIAYSKNADYPFNWVDISSSGTPLGLSDDSTFYPVPFEFEFYGEPHGQIAISSNGAVYFENTNINYTNREIPNSATPQALIAPFWDDLNPSGVGEIYYEIRGTRLIVQWDNLPHFSNAGAVSFQLVLDQSNGDILMQYLDVDFDEVAYDS
ncbi:MAG: S8 family serine peptidase, partial [Methylococcales bacterium]|nr:S8 family serine peptidase [Methylococcales bacterium]